MLMTIDDVENLNIAADAVFDATHGASSGD